ncbi:MAG TPA: hypothetical protein VGK59_11885 [Ohtaekwangia sp.]
MEATDPLISYSTCDNCNAQVSTEKFCTRCGFPVNGTEDEKTQYKGKVMNTRLSLKEAQDKIDKAKLIIYVLAGFTFIFGLVAGLVNDDMPTMVVNMVICVLYIILAFWASTNPFGAILTCFIIYITLQIVNAIVEPSTLISGILWKVIFIGAFVKGIQSASEAQKLMKEMNQYKGRAGGTD